ncbi:MAG TPA: type II secretion system F family protein [Gemmataceae bacterium]|nr:type II secretion system F family protein [Gemmataceae bacterium]
MLDKGWISMLVFLATSALVLGFFVWRNRDIWQTKARMRGLGATPRERTAGGGLGKILLARLPDMGTPLLPTTEEQRGRLRQRLIEAGIYDRHALALLLGVKMLLMAAPLVLSGALGLTGMLSPIRAVFAGILGIGLGMIGPGLWLDYRKNARQTGLRRAMPDALDMLVLCVEGGLSLTGAMQRVTAELKSAHPLLGAEMDLVQREMMLGVSVGEGLQKMAARTDLEELRNLASIIVQSERFGTSVVKALRIHADTLRQQRQQRAEEMAQKAAVKILFPTLLCIFPAIFIVILGPAAFQILTVFSRMK